MEVPLSKYWCQLQSFIPGPYKTIQDACAWEIYENAGEAEEKADVFVGFQEKGGLMFKILL